MAKFFRSNAIIFQMCSISYMHYTWAKPIELEPISTPILVESFNAIMLKLNNESTSDLAWSVHKICEQCWFCLEIQLEFTFFVWQIIFDLAKLKRSVKMRDFFVLVFFFFVNRQRKIFFKNILEITFSKMRARSPRELASNSVLSTLLTCCISPTKANQSHAVFLQELNSLCISRDNRQF